ncbi:MAG: response regulator [Dehalococcoidia bacterium]
MAVRPRTITVLLVDDHTVLRESTHRLLAEIPDIEVVGEAADSEQALALAELYRPQVVLLDIKLQRGSGIEIARELRSRLPEARILALTGYDAEPYVRAMLALGVQGYLLKDTSFQEVVDAIRTVYEGGTVFSAGVAARLAKSYASGEMSSAYSRLHQLTPKELQVLEQVALGARNTQIGEYLNISPRTVEVHIGRVLSKLGAHSRSEAVAKALRQGLIVVGPP